MANKIKGLLITLVLISLLILGGISYTAYRLWTIGKVELIELREKFFPQFDYEQADTKANKQRFKDFLMIKPTPDIKDIYCFDDALGINADYMFSFSCSKATSQRIIQVHKLKLDTAYFRDDGFHMQHDFIWWNKERICKLPKYQWISSNKRWYKYYWYDDEESKAYFFEFDF